MNEFESKLRPGDIVYTIDSADCWTWQIKQREVKRVSFDGEHEAKIELDDDGSTEWKHNVFLGSELGAAVSKIAFENSGDSKENDDDDDYEEKVTANN